MRARVARRSCACSWTGPAGVDLDLCARVTHHLRDLLVDYGVEVSSPGPERPLTKLEHYQRYLGRRVRVRTVEAIEGRSDFKGELVGADAEGVSLAADWGMVRIPLERIRRSNLISQPDGLEEDKLSKEIVEAVQTLEKEKGISSEKLMLALEDALLSAYKKTPGAAKYARVDMDRGDGRLPRVRADPAAGARGEAGRRGDRGGAHDRPGDGRAARARGARDRPREAGRVRGPDLDAAT